MSDSMMTCTQCGERATTAQYHSVTRIAARGETTMCFDTDECAVYLHEDL